MEKVLLLSLLLAMPAFAGGWGNQADDQTVNVTNNSHNTRVNNSVRDESVTNTAAQEQRQTQSVQSSNQNHAGAYSSQYSHTGDVENTSNVNVHSSGNNSSAEGGNARSHSAASGGTSGAAAVVDVDASTTIPKPAANSAASMYAQVCMAGASAQGRSGGFSVTHSDGLCNWLKMAAANYDAYTREASRCECVGICTSKEASVELLCRHGNMAPHYLELYHDNMAEAQTLLEKTKPTTFWGKVFGESATFWTILGIGIAAL